MFNKVAAIMQFDLVNSRTFKHLSKYFQGLEFRIKKFKDFQGL